MSSSSTPRAYSYDVFLSFRGGDTRKTIVSHLHSQLQSKKLSIFKDDRDIEVGDTISEELDRAIRTSRFAIVVLSKNYATSSWCLEELQLIMELEKKKDIGVIPIFYHVDPSDVRKHQKDFSLKCFKSRPKVANKVSKWREALVSIANLCGKDYTNWLDEATMVQDIVQRVLSRVVSILPKDLGDIVGIEAHMEGLRPHIDSNDEVRMIGIWGMGGVGKSTIAEYLYEEHKFRFSYHRYFIKNVTGNSSGVSDLEKQILHNILGKKGNVKSMSKKEVAMYIKTKVGKIKACVVFDNVDHVDQLNPLVNEVTWFGPGSLIIITTRNKSLLDSCGVSMVYNVKCLDKDKALQLFQKVAFNGGKAPSRDHKGLSRRISRLAQGLPLALHALGASLRNKPLLYWRDALNSFEEAPYENIIKILKLSYDGLNVLDKITFLYVACLFNGEFAYRIEKLLERGEVGILNLVESSLIDISAKGYIVMHALVEQTGKQIVRQNSTNTYSQQRILWHHADILPLLQHRGINTSTEGLALDTSQKPHDFHINWNFFKPMSSLKFLKIYKHFGSLREDLILKKDFSVPQELRLLHWDAYPFTTLPLDHPYSLVELNLCHSKLKTLWSEIPPKLWHLRRLDLTGSKDLKLLPDLKEAVCLEELILKDCISLKWIPNSVCKLSKLQILDMSNCNGLKNLKITIKESNSTVSQGKSLQVRSIRLYFGAIHNKEESWGNTSLSNMSIRGKVEIKLEALEGNAENLCFVSDEKHLVAHEPVMLNNQTKLHYGFKSLDIMRFNWKNGSDHFICNSFLDFPWLMKLKLINLNIKEIPPNIDLLKGLEELDLSGNDFSMLPNTMIQLTKLKHLTLCNCRMLEELPELCQLETLTLSDCTNLRALVSFGHEKGYNLLELWIDNCKNVEALSDQLARFQKLTYLDISRHDFETLPISIKELKYLVTLCLNYCNKLMSLTDLPLNLKCLTAHGCNESLLTSSHSINHSIDHHFNLSICLQLKQNFSQIIRFPAGKQSEEVHLCGCFQKTEILSTNNNQMTWNPITIIFQRLIWLFAICILVVILLVTGMKHVTITTTDLYTYLNTLFMVILLYKSFNSTII